MQQMIYWLLINSQHVSGVFTPTFRSSNCLTLPLVSNPVLFVVSRSRVVRCVHCEEFELLKMGVNTPETC
jgi:hypothetical protein